MKTCSIYTIEHYMKQEFLLNGNELTAAQVVAAAADSNYQIDLTPETWDNIRIARKAVEDMVA